MSEKINYAFPEQNNEKFIKLLKAQRYYYKVAKRWQNWRLILSMVIPILFILAKLKSLKLNEFESYKNMFNWLDLSFIVILSLIWIAMSFIFRILEKQYISLGASIQEKFDTKLFKLDKNTICFLKEPTVEEINKGAKRFKGDSEKLKDWYHLEYSGNKFLNILLAQRTNIVWDRRLKERYRNFLICVIIIIFIMEIIIASYLNPSFKEAISILFLSSFPLYFLLGEYAYELHRQITSNKAVDKQILNICESINKFFDIKLKFKCRQIQDYIYEKNRLKSILIPEWLYWLRRDKDNNDILEINNELVKNLRKV